MDRKKIWQTTLGELEVILSKANFTTWFKDTFIHSIDNGIVIVAVPNSFTETWLRNKYHDQIQLTLQKLVPDLQEVKYKITSREVPESEKTKTGDKQKTKEVVEKKEIVDIVSIKEGSLNRRYTFDSYIVGNSNRLAYATSKAVSSEPGTKHNPLFIYGGVGLGKTHLIQAVGNEITRRNPRKRIIYASCEKFANEFIDSIQNKRIDSFKKNYRNADLLLIDDIQFLGGKESTQEEFFHTFNSLYQTNRQIILTSDRPPQALSDVANRLTSRFAGGMVADIKAPDLEMRNAILKAKCNEQNFILDDDIINYIAEHIQSNIRELEGSLNKIVTHCELYNLKPSLDNVSRILEEMISSSKIQCLTPEKILKIVSGFFTLKKEDLLGKHRQRELVHPRQICMFLLKREMNYSYPMIGRFLGGKDHTTVMHGVGKIEKELTKNPQTQREISLIKEQVYMN